MSMKSGTVWWVECDGCGQRPEDGEGYEPVHDTAAGARAAAKERSITEVNGQWLCDGCVEERRIERSGSA